jgi:hypothetical protein
MKIKKTANKTKIPTKLILKKLNPIVKVVRTIRTIDIKIMKNI